MGVFQKWRRPSLLNPHRKLTPVSRDGPSNRKRFGGRIWGSSSFPFDRGGDVGRQVFSAAQRMADPCDLKLSRGDLTRGLPALASAPERPLMASATWSDGSSSDHTLTAIWTSSNSSMVVALASGHVVSLGAGTVAIAATVNGLGKSLRPDGPPDLVVR